jgi:RimJ/RimL family protein N-acetyltransferase
VLDVFATNNGAIQFYERCGYRPDHIRMAKPVT